jgi:hypothetical protein
LRREQVVHHLDGGDETFIRGDESKIKEESKEESSQNQSYI